MSKITWMTFSKAAKLLRTNFRGCRNESFKAVRLGDVMRRTGDDGIWPLTDADGEEWEVGAHNVLNITEMKRIVPSYKSIFDA